MKFPKARPHILSKQAEAKLREQVWRLRRAECFIRDGHKCRICTTRRACDVHHLLARSLGGGMELHNLLSLCRSCHELVTGHVFKLRWRDDRNRASTIHVERVA
jgi:5-methylcytosine-specific restriction endonuclease McrA